MEEEEAGKKKKKSKGLATVFSVFTKRRKKKGKPSLAETEGESESCLQPPAQLPTDIRVVAAYAESYHAEFASQLSALTQFELCPRDTYMLLLWVQNLYPNDILNSPKLAPELQGVRLGTLLPPTQIQLLEARFLSNEVTRVRELMARALELESKRWTKDEAPLRLNSRCFSELAIHIIQIISQGQAKAESITLDLGAQIKPLLLEELARFLRSYQRAFDGFLERCRQLRNYRANVIANINNCLPFRTSLEQQWQTPPDLRSSLLRPLNELKSLGFDTLLQSLFGDLKPLFKRFTQTRWAAPQQTLEEIVSAVAERMPEFSELQDCFQEELLEAVHLHLVKEYIARLCKRRLVLKTAEQQQQLAGHVQANAQLIQQFCTQNGSPATWLHDALPRLAEIIRLQDPSAIKIEVASYATLYPDFSKGHLSAILTIKGNLSSSDAKSIRSILDINTGAHEPSKALFSLIKAWLRSWPLSRWNWNSCVLMTPPVGQEPSGEALWMRVELARPEGGVRRVCGSGTQLRDHRLSARSCHTCLRTALLRLGLWSPVSPSPDRGPSLTPSACCGAGSRRAGLSL